MISATLTLSSLGVEYKELNILVIRHFLLPLVTMICFYFPYQISDSLKFLHIFRLI